MGSSDLRMLRDDLAGELASINQYFEHGQAARDPQVGSEEQKLSLQARRSGPKIVPEGRQWPRMPGATAAYRDTVHIRTDSRSLRGVLRPNQRGQRQFLAMLAAVLGTNFVSSLYPVLLPAVRKAGVVLGNGQDRFPEDVQRSWPRVRRHYVVRTYLPGAGPLITMSIGCFRNPRLSDEPVTAPRTRSSIGSSGLPMSITVTRLPRSCPM